MNVEWETPKALREVLNRYFQFSLDAAATRANAICHRYLTDALSESWAVGSGVVWCNPPYNQLPAFVARGADQVKQHGIHLLMLIPAYTDTRYWHEIIRPTAETVIFLKGRLSFELHGRRQTTARFPSALVRWQSRPPFARELGPQVRWWDWRAEI